MSAPFVPTPLFGCCQSACATDVSYTGDMLRWLPDRSDLVCQVCWEEDLRDSEEWRPDDPEDDTLMWDALDPFHFKFEVLP